MKYKIIAISLFFSLGFICNDGSSGSKAEYVGNWQFTEIAYIEYFELTENTFSLEKYLHWEPDELYTGMRGTSTALPLPFQRNARNIC